MPKTIRITAEAKLPDERNWTNRFAHKGDSGSVYTISQDKTKRFWGCGCMGWRNHRKCKHLTQLGLPNHEQPMEVNLVVMDGLSNVREIASPTYAPAAKAKPGDAERILTSLGRRKLDL